MRPSPRSTGVVAALLGLAQGVCWTAMAVVAYLVFTCRISGGEYPDKLYFLYLIYLYNPTCAPPPRILDHDIPWNKSVTSQVLITHDLALAYMVTCSLWTLASAVLLGLTVTDSRHVLSEWCRYLWSLAAAAIVALDLLATVSYGFDMTSDQQAEKDLEMLNVADGEKQVLTATVVMMALTSRCFVLWFANAVLVVLVARSARLIRQTRKDGLVLSTEGPPRAVVPVLKSQPQPVQNGVAVYQQKPPMPQQQQQQQQKRMNGHATPPTSESPRRPNSFDGQGRPPSHQIDPRLAGEITGYSILPLKTGFDPFTIPEAASEDGSATPSEAASEIRQEAPSTPEERPASTTPPPEEDFKERLSRQLAAPRPPSSSMYFNRDTNEGNDSPRSSSRQPPKQLRNLLPWNYLASPDDQVPSPRRGARDPDLEMPPVPVPDYTLHFGPKKRERIVSNISTTSSVAGSVTSSN